VRVTSSGTATNASPPTGDYSFTSPTDLLFSPFTGASSSQPVSLSLYDDITDENDETAVLSLAIQSDGTGGQASVGASFPSHAITIQDDDDAGARFFDLPTAGSFTVTYNSGTNSIEIHQGSATGTV